MGALRDLPNIGSVTERQLIQVGIETPEELGNVGSKEALLRIRAAVDPGACLSLLSALEGAIRGVRWHDLPEDVKADLKAFHKAL